MAIIPPGFGAVSIELKHSGLARPSFITFGIDNNSGATDPGDVASAIEGAGKGAGSFTSRLNTEVTCGPVTVRLGQDGGEPTVGVSLTTSAGLLNIVTPPQNVAVLIQKRTALGGRRNRGRLYLPWYIDEAGVDEVGTITVGSIAAIQAAMTAWRSALVAANLPMVILHNPGVTITPAPVNVTSLFCTGLISTQRRRLGR